MRNKEYPGLHRLKALLADLDPGSDEAVGLLMAGNAYLPHYDATPKEALVFATTGGDGVHFSFLPGEVADPDDWPVVMTVPMQFDRPNLIVGSDLAEFLALGLSTGYFLLEQLAYDDEDLLEALASGRGYVSSDLMGRTLDAIANEFSLKPWPEHRQRLSQLQLQFAPR